MRGHQALRAITSFLIISSLLAFTACKDRGRGIEKIGKTITVSVTPYSFYQLYAEPGDTVVFVKYDANDPDFTVKPLNPAFPCHASNLHANGNNPVKCVIPANSGGYFGFYIEQGAALVTSCRGCSLYVPAMTGAVPAISGAVPGTTVSQSPRTLTDCSTSTNAVVIYCDQTGTATACPASAVSQQMIFWTNENDQGKWTVTTGTPAACSNGSTFLPPSASSPQSNQCIAGTASNTDYTYDVTYDACTNTTGKGTLRIH